MASNLPKIGLEAIIEGATKFVKDLDSVNKRIDEATKNNKNAAKSATPLSKELDKVGLSFDSIKEKIAGFAGINSKAVDGLQNILQGILPLGPAATVATAGIVGLGAAFLALGNRGAPLINLGRAFDNLSASVGLTSTALLVDLRKASAGTIADFDLIRTANDALLGATGKFGQEFGKNLPKLLEIARAASRATGKDFNTLFENIVTGVKRASPRILDNLGIIISEKQANEDYAKSIGKTVEQLTEQDKKVATLNATLTAGQQIIEATGNAQETAADKTARSGAIITNIFDTLAVAVQPAFNTVLDLVNRILGGFDGLAKGIAPILGAVASIITDVLGGAFNSILDIIEPVISAIGSFLPYIAILFQGLEKIISPVVNFIRDSIGKVVGFVQSIAKNLFGLDISNLGKFLFEGAAKAFGSFANGIIAVANQLIFPAVIKIAQFIADFLIGQSPPPKGPLHDIDKGGFNAMSAWVEGLTGVSLDPVAQVAAEVSAALGDIGKESLPQVNARLAQLDAALLPFQNRLDIVKAQFDAIAEPAKEALDAIDRQVQEAQDALSQGDQAAAARVRALDAAREAIQGQLDAQQQLVDQQQIQLALATASQAQERALLNIRKAALDTTQKQGQATQAAVEKQPKEKTVKGAAGAAASGEAVTPSLPGVSNGPSVLDTLGGQDAVNQAIAGIQDAFAGQIDTSQLSLFQQNQGDLQKQLDRFKGVDIGAKIGDKFKGLVSAFDPSNPDSIPAKIGGFVSTLTADENTDGSIAHFFVNVGPSVQNALSTLTADASTPGSVAYLFANLGPNIEAARPAVEDALKSIFDPNAEGSPAKFVVDTVMNLTGDQNTANSVASFFSQLPENVGSALSTLGDQLTGAFAGVQNFLTGDGDGTLSSILDSAVAFFAELPSRIVTALQGIGLAIYTAVVVPVINVINTLIGILENALKSLISSVANFLYNVADTLGSVIDTTGIRNTANDITAKANSISFGRISAEVPAFLQATPGAATGGQFSKGLLKVGERGPEYVMNAQKMGVLPAELTRVLDGLGGILAQPAPMMIPAGDTYNSSSSTFNFNGVQGDNDARRRYNALRAGMR